MKKQLTIFLFLLFSFNVFAEKIIFVDSAEGNLESPNPCGCVELSEVTNQHNPADIFNGVKKCLENREFNKAISLYLLANTYGRYDAYRVQDRSAHQAIAVLRQYALANLDRQNKMDFSRDFKETLSNSSKKRRICQAIKKIGKPEYYPRYMIQHGIKAFLGGNGSGLVEDFDSNQSWHLSLTKYLGCNG